MRELLALINLANTEIQAGNQQDLRPVCRRLIDWLKVRSGQSDGGSSTYFLCLEHSFQLIQDVITVAMGEAD